jgi:hypothetical protein
MTNIFEKLQQTENRDADLKPIFFDLANESDQNKLSELFATNVVNEVIDDYHEEQLELYGVMHPDKVYQPGFKDTFAEYYKTLFTDGTTYKHGVWVFFPWLGKLVHILPEHDFYLVRTARNKNLITKDEQDKFYNAVVGIGGLSVGSSVALSIVVQGGAKHIKLADFDRLALSNTNRIRTGVQSLGLLKVIMAAREIYQINPYATVELFPEGITQENLESFFVGTAKLDVVIDELDNLAVKFLIREQAKKHHVPVVMGADNGDNAVIDIERYDLDPEMPFFHGRMGDVSYDMLKNLDKFGIGKMITKHIGAENVTEKMQQSLLEMGKTIVSWPQLGGAAFINGSAVAYAVRKIVNGQPIEDNRALISLDEKLVPEYMGEAQTTHRAQIADAFKKIFGL